MPRLQGQQIASPFLRLPAELRNQIYRHYFHRRRWLIIDPKYFVEPEATCVPSLVPVCLQIYQEAESFRYSECIISSNGRRCFDRWFLGRTEIQKQAISRFELRCNIVLDYESAQACSGPIDPYASIVRGMPNLQEIHIRITASSLRERYMLISDERDGIPPVIAGIKHLVEVLAPRSTVTAAHPSCPQTIKGEVLKSSGAPLHLVFTPHAYKKWRASGNSELAPRTLVNQKYDLRTEVYG